MVGNNSRRLQEDEHADFEVLFELAQEDIDNCTGVLKTKDIGFLFGDEESVRKGFKPLKEKFDKYGVGMYISDAQFEWAMSLLAKLQKAANPDA